MNRYSKQDFNVGDRVRFLYRESEPHGWQIQEYSGTISQVYSNGWFRIGGERFEKAAVTEWIDITRLHETVTRDNIGNIHVKVDYIERMQLPIG